MLHTWNHMYFMFLPSTKSKNKPKNIYDRVRSRKAIIFISSFTTTGCYLHSVLPHLLFLVILPYSDIFIPCHIHTCICFLYSYIIREILHEREHVVSFWGFIILINISHSISSVFLPRFSYLLIDWFFGNITSCTSVMFISLSSLLPCLPPPL